MSDEKAATLGQLLQSDLPHWCWVYCETYGCHHRAPMAYAPFAIRWGMDATTEDLQRSARCQRCGNKRATLRMPSWGGSATGWQDFPVERIAHLKALAALIGDNGNESEQPWPPTRSS